MVSRAREYPHSEEGGVLVGHIDYEDWDPLSAFERPMPCIHVLDFIPSGPRTIRNSVSLYSDLAFQEYEFERLSELDPRVLHLGSWHSHHSNGVSQLSQGDLRSYFNIVESPRHAHDYYVAILLYRMPWKTLKNVGDVFKHFKFYIIHRPSGRRCLELERSCIRVTSGTSPYAGFISSGYTLPASLKRRELFARSWFKTTDARKIIREDNTVLTQIAEKNRHLIEGSSRVVEGAHGMILVRRFRIGRLYLEYRYPEMSIEDGIDLRVSRTRPGARGVEPIASVRGRPIEIRHHIFSAIVECFQPRNRDIGRKPYSSQGASADE